MSAIDRALTAWRLQHHISSEVISPLSKKLAKSYTIYGSMLLLPATLISSPEWSSLQEQTSPSTLTSLYEKLCNHLKITHIACNHPIPLHDQIEDSMQSENILRAPRNFTPLYGDFGPAEIAVTSSVGSDSGGPTQEDFARAFWATVKQNGIWQVWAPRWTMFSRGNISEKARLLTLPSVLQAAKEGRQNLIEHGTVDREAGFDVVDLYAGIGYFTFSYVKAGARRVFGWDLNPWSVEGLVRGARRNKWEVEVLRRNESDGGDDESGAMEKMGASNARILVFNESNEMAPERLRDLAQYRELNIRHVNLGMLPTSRKALELAADFVSVEPKGWLHVHENFLVEEIESKAEETRQEFEKILLRSSNPRIKALATGQMVKAVVEYINRLKNYAPGVMHCVLDIGVEVV